MLRLKVNVIISGTKDRKAKIIATLDRLLKLIAIVPIFL